MVTPIWRNRPGFDLRHLSEELRSSVRAQREQVAVDRVAGSELGSRVTGAGVVEKPIDPIEAASLSRWPTAKTCITWICRLTHLAG